MGVEHASVVHEVKFDVNNRINRYFADYFSSNILIFCFGYNTEFIVKVKLIKE